MSEIERAMKWRTEKKVKQLTMICWYLIAPPHPPTSLDLSGEVGWPCYFLLWLKDYILETYMLLAELGVGQ